MSQSDIHEFQNPADIDIPKTGAGPGSVAPGGDDGASSTTGDDRSKEQIEEDKKLAERLSALIEDANSRVVPLCKMIRKVSPIPFPLLHYLPIPKPFKHIENMEAKKEEDRNEDELVKQVKPLLQQAEKILSETEGMVKGE